MKPNNKEEEKRFWKFRCDDVAEMFKLKVCLELIAVVIVLTDSIYNPESRSTLLRVYCRVLYAILHIAVFLISKRFKHGFVYLIPILYLYNSTINEFATQYGTPERESLISGEYAVESGQFYRILLPFLFFPIFFSPDFSNILCGYLPISFCGVVGVKLPNRLFMKRSTSITSMSFI